MTTWNSSEKRRVLLLPLTQTFVHPPPRVSHQTPQGAETALGFLQAGTQCRKQDAAKQLENKGNFWRIDGVGGGDGIRTHVRGFPLKRFSKPPPSATRPPLRREGIRRPVSRPPHGVCAPLLRAAGPRRQAPSVIQPAQPGNRRLRSPAPGSDRRSDRRTPRCPRRDGSGRPAPASPGLRSTAGAPPGSRYRRATWRW